MKIKDLTKEDIKVPAGLLCANPKNWKHHPQKQQQAMADILDEVGFAGSILAYRDGEDIVILDGHLRVSLADADELIPVKILDLEPGDPRIAKLLATHDPVGLLSEADVGKLDSLLEDITFDNSSIVDLMVETVQPPEPISVEIPAEVLPMKPKGKTREKKDRPKIHVPPELEPASTRAVQLTIPADRFEEFMIKLEKLKSLMEDPDTANVVMYSVSFALDQYPDDPNYAA